MFVAKLRQHCAGHCCQYIFPGKDNWKTRPEALSDGWLQQHRLPRALRGKFQDFCDEQWVAHSQALEESGRLTWSQVQGVKSKLRQKFVLYNEDHHLNHVVCYCPQFYMRSILTTWDDPATFESLQGSPKHWQQEMLKNIPSKLFRRYAWAINSTADLPRETVFLKRKKQYQKGRTIISYAGSLCNKLLQLASIAITIMTRALYPDTPGLQSMPQLWRSLHRHWSKPSAEPEQEWNDDLVGFFNAVPRKDIIRAVNVLTEQYLKQSGCTVLSVDLLSTSGHQGKPRGRMCSSFKRCWVEDMPLIVQVSFSTERVTAAGKCRLQKEGTCIGNQISPVLSGLPVLLAEQTFWKSLPRAFFSSFLFLRYVDNRLILAPSHILQQSQIQQFCLPDFYKGIQLESVEDHQWLGFTIDAPARTATFNLPTKPWQVRSPASAGSWQLAASGSALISQYAWPKESALPQVRALQEIYVQAGFSRDSAPLPRVD